MSRVCHCWLPLPRASRVRLPNGASAMRLSGKTARSASRGQLASGTPSSTPKKSLTSPSSGVVGAKTAIRICLLMGGSDAVGA
eukprot:1661557-Prymnesium_polylepis.1